MQREVSEAVRRVWTSMYVAKHIPALSGARRALQFVQRRVADRCIIRLIQEWLGAGVMAGGEMEEHRHGYAIGVVR